MTEGKTLNLLISLQDQWQTEKEILLGRPFIFCNPVVKVVQTAGAQTKFPIVDPISHLVCYQRKLIPFQKSTFFVNQFNNFKGFMLDPDLFCVPSTKDQVSPPIPSLISPTFQD